MNLTKTGYNLIKKTILIIVILIVSSFKVAKYDLKSKRVNDEEYFSLSLVNDEYDKIKSHINKSDNFYKAIGKSESSNRYYVINKYGYCGNYQFSIRNLNLLGIDTLLLNYSELKSKKRDSILKSRFLKTPKSQEIAMYRFLKFNNEKLKKYILKFNNKKIKLSDTAVFVTKTGILAAAHLSGYVNVIKFFETIEKREEQLLLNNNDSIPAYSEILKLNKVLLRKNKKDKLGTSIVDYISKFSKYKVFL
jgi:hypothetical protein